MERDEGIEDDLLATQAGQGRRHQHVEVSEIAHHHHIVVRRLSKIAPAEPRVAVGQLAGQPHETEGAGEGAGLVAPRLPDGLVALHHARAVLPQPALEDPVPLVVGLVSSEVADPHRGDRSTGWDPERRSFVRPRPGPTAVASTHRTGPDGPRGHRDFGWFRAEACSTVPHARASAVRADPARAWLESPLPDTCSAASGSSTTWSTCPAGEPSIGCGAGALLQGI